jgi:hypothetical protein
MLAVFALLVCHNAEELLFCKLFDETIVLYVYRRYWIIHQLHKHEVTYKLSNLRSFRELSKVKYVLLNHICKIRGKLLDSLTVMKFVQLRGLFFLI